MLHVDTCGRPFQPHASVDEVLDVHLALVGRSEHVKKECCILDVEAYYLEVVSVLAVIQGLLEVLLLEGIPVAVHLLAHPPKLLLLRDLVRAVLESERVSVRLRQLHSVLHEDAGEDVQKGNLDEGDEEDEQRRVLEAGAFDGLIRLLPVDAARGRLVQGQHGLADRAEQPPDALLAAAAADRVALQEVGNVVGGALNEDEGEDVEDQRQHDYAPEE
mmetsp:Transcript_21335/g.61686  ORF Transcript_21335/g.61686 Transcript_21335/m.61686 type:complete len:217 (+) Transcript_21335:256-906(+)